MLQSKLEKRLDLTLKPSRLFFLYLSGIFTGAVISLFFYNSLSITIRLICFGLLLFSSTYIILNNKNKTISRLTITAESDWEITVNNETYSAELFGECIVTYLFTWLNFSCFDKKGEKRIFRVLILPDSTDKNLLRQLRVRLRFGKVNNADDSAFTAELSERFIK